LQLHGQLYSASLQETERTELFLSDACPAQSNIDESGRHKERGLEASEGAAALAWCD